MYLFCCILYLFLLYFGKWLALHRTIALAKVRFIFLVVMVMVIIRRRRRVEKDYDDNDNQQGWDFSLWSLLR